MRVGPECQASRKCGCLTGKECVAVLALAERSAICHAAFPEPGAQLHIVCGGGFMPPARPCLTVPCHAMTGGRARWDRGSPAAQVRSGEPADSGLPRALHSSLAARAVAVTQPGASQSPHPWCGRCAAAWSEMLAQRPMLNRRSCMKGDGGKAKCSGSCQFADFWSGMGDASSSNP
jgi:hypothetical protein